ncbi:FmdB family zinc ribbon protein [Pseudonocardia sp. T1-2H]|uniref:FmdB family zinc ribbon protein n=1 Tax=Pseudonocardia sp. T1-2H TaxID=3128899 RepID=UPI003100AF0A
MPTYQYACTACDHRFEAVQSFSDDALSVCPQCGGKLRKVFSSVGIVFKGSGFYRTDSRAGAVPSSSSSSSSSDSSAGSSDGSSSKSESKSSSSSTSSSDTKSASTSSFPAAAAS